MMSDDGWLTCDHCRSSMDEPVLGMRGEYCCNGCYYAEELDGPTAHDTGVAAECPSCNLAAVSER